MTYLQMEKLPVDLSGGVERNGALVLRPPDKISFCLLFYELEMKGVWVKQISCCKLQADNGSSKEGTGAWKCPLKMLFLLYLP